ncbi:hypothetical protein Poli38472_004348 [Pythium oligandrum]|uniref:Probable pectate lyase F n=1 Tax=Pythium oligandrum TaxID=41045 RepID=A0A8K1FFS2_PYTOL|nr:hypothetical protein Poli38472_004348 [Pythium oligandrum]|eukprot:TMW59279.1 hypothetical protein Poli38472_004348 [Pythium oligandrum]
MILSLLRRREESVIFAQQSIQVCIQHYTDAMILSSFFGDYDEQVKSRFGKGKKGERNQHQAGFPILPFIYLMVAGLKDSSKWEDTDVRDLLSVKMERSKMIALFKAVNQHASNVSKSPSKSKSSSPSKKKKPTEMFSTTEVDLAMAKSAGSTKRPLIFDEFREALQSLADLKMNHVTIWWSRFEGPEARVLAMLWQYVFVVTDVKPLAALLAAHASSVVHERAKAIQRLMLKGRDKAQGHLIRLQMLSEREMELKRNAITRVQCRIRVLLAKKQYKLKLQAQYEKYIDPDWMLPYWMNPRTGYSTWLKPRVLEDDDVSSEAIPFPTPALTLSMDCQGERECKTCSDIYCYECDDAFCNKCVAQRFHKQDKADHEVEVLQKCGLCKFQIASRKCIDCKAMKEARGGKRNGGKARQDKDKFDSDVAAAPEDDVLFCDVCFAFTHKRGALQVHKSLPLLEMCVDCLDDDEALDHEKAPPVKPFAKAAQWQCNTCFNRRICSSCATTKHPVEACGELERVSLVTMTMKQRADRIAREIAEKERADVERMKRLILEAKRERYVKKIQKFWRNQAPLLRARRIARQLRGEKDAHWQQIQQDAKTQKEFKYRAKNLVGFAPPLPTDSPVQQKLREMNALQRRQLSIRARMFGLLISEYMVLGVPLPGIARVGRGQHFIECTEDLRGWLLNRQTIRLKKLPKVKRRQKELADEPLPDFVWRHDLEKWMRDPSDTILVDIHSKEKLTERQVPLSIGFLVEPKKDGPAVAPKANKDEDEELDVEEYALFLVEYSMDPKRVVWINHSFAEQFAAWRRQKFHAYRERQAQMKAEALEKLQEAKKNEQKESPTQAPLVVDTAPVVAAATEDTTASSTWPTAAYAPETPATSSSAYYDYSGYYSQQTSWPTSSWASSPYGYDYSNAGFSGYDSTGATTVTDPSIPQLEASNEYFYADDGNAAAWEAYYQANPSATTEYFAGWNTGAEESYPYTGDYYNTETETAYQQYDATYQQQSTYEVQPSSAAYATDAYPASNYATAYDPYSETSAAYYAAGSYSTAGYEGYTTAASAATASWPWEEVFDPSTNHAYYYNHETQETSWQVPS